jgi:hypothetical protein
MNWLDKRYKNSECLGKFNDKMIENRLLRNQPIKTKIIILLLIATLFLMKK